MRESTYTAAIKKKLAEIEPSLYALKINLRFGSGVPDNWYSGDARDLWVEYKYLATIPPIVRPRTLLSALQEDWLRKRHAQGRNVAMIVGSGNGGLILPGLSWDDEFTREEFLQASLSKILIAEWINNFTSFVDLDSARSQSAAPSPTRH